MILAARPSGLPPMLLAPLFAGLLIVAQGFASPALALSGDPTILGPVPPAPAQPGTGGIPLPPPGQQQPLDQGAVPQPDNVISSSPLPTQPAAPPPVQSPGQLPTQPGVLGSPAGTLPAGALPSGTLPGESAIIPAGQLDDSSGGLGGDLWAGSETSRLMVLVPQLPAPVTVPPLRDLQRRLLMTAAASAGALNGIDPLVPMRADRLLAMGFGAQARELAEAGAAAGPMDPQEAVEKLLLAGDDPNACARVDAALASATPPDPFFSRAAIYCQIAREQTDMASLGLDLLRERKEKDRLTRDFIALSALALGETKRKPKSIAEADPLNVALLRRLGLPAPQAIGTAVEKPVGAAGAVMIARDSARPLVERLPAAEQAYALGLIDGRELADLYLVVPAGNADPASAIGLADNSETRARLYQAAARSFKAPDRLRLIQAAMDQARRRGDYLAQAMLYAPLVQAIQPARDLVTFAPEAARILFAGGNIDKAGFWLNLAASFSADPNLAWSRPGLDLLARVAGLSVSVVDPVEAWRQANGAASQRAQLMYALLAGLGDDVAGQGGQTQQAGIIAPGTPPAIIAAAAAGNRRGETVTLALIGLGGDRALDADPATVKAALLGLGAVGLKAEAREIARAIAILAGL